MNSFISLFRYFFNNKPPIHVPEVVESSNMEDNIPPHSYPVELNYMDAGVSRLEGYNTHRTDFEDPIDLNMEDVPSTSNDVSNIIRSLEMVNDKHNYNKEISNTRDFNEVSTKNPSKKRKKSTVKVNHKSMNSIIQEMIDAKNVIEKGLNDINDCCTSYKGSIINQTKQIQDLQVERLRSLATINALKRNVMNYHSDGSHINNRNKLSEWIFDTNLQSILTMDKDHLSDMLQIMYYLMDNQEIDRYIMVLKIKVKKQMDEMANAKKKLNDIIRFVVRSLVKPTIVSDDLWNEVVDELKCCICHDNITDPVVLTCSHILCRACYNTDKNTQKEKQDYFAYRCAMCRCYCYNDDIKTPKSIITMINMYNNLFAVDIDQDIETLLNGGNIEHEIFTPQADAGPYTPLIPNVNDEILINKGREIFDGKIPGLEFDEELKSRFINRLSSISYMITPETLKWSGVGENINSRKRKLYDIRENEKYYEKTPFLERLNISAKSRFASHIVEKSVRRSTRTVKKTNRLIEEDNDGHPRCSNSDILHPIQAAGIFHCYTTRCNNGFFNGWRPRSYEFYLRECIRLKKRSMDREAFCLAINEDPANVAVLMRERMREQQQLDSSSDVFPVIQTAPTETNFSNNETDNIIPPDAYTDNATVNFTQEVFPFQTSEVAPDQEPDVALAQELDVTPFQELDVALAQELDVTPAQEPDVFVQELFDTLNMEVDITTAVQNSNDIPSTSNPVESVINDRLSEYESNLYDIYVDTLVEKNYIPGIFSITMLKNYAERFRISFVELIERILNYVNNEYEF